MASHQDFVTAQEASPSRSRKRTREAQCPEGKSCTRKRRRHSSVTPERSLNEHEPDTQCRGQQQDPSHTPALKREELSLPVDPTGEPSNPLPLAAAPDTSGQESFIAHWVRRKQWPKEGFRGGFLQPRKMSFPVAQRKMTQSIRRKRSESSIADSSTPSDQKPREVKTAPYTHSSYPLLLDTKGVRMEKSEFGISDKSKELCRNLLNTSCEVPANTLFQDDIMEDSIHALEGRNESRVVQDIARLLVPSAETLARISDKSFKVLVESVNEGWDNCFPLTDPRPQPDYAVGFRQSSLGLARLQKLRVLIGDEPFLHQSCLLATRYMYLPFLTSEVKCGTTGLEIAERQNAHSMGIAVRAIMSIFELGKRQEELHRRILTFSVSHNDVSVRLSGWYPVIKGDTYTIHRHDIRYYTLLDMEGREKWATYRFTVGVYRYAVDLLQELNEIIDTLPPDLDFESIQALRRLKLGNQEFAPPGRPVGSSKQSEAGASEHLHQVTPDTIYTQQSDPKRAKS